MSLPIVFRRIARVEFDEAHDWYEKRHTGLGQKFSASVQEVLDRIAITPQVHQCIFKDVRRGVVRGFPYGVMYRVTPKQIRILAVFHGSRDPAIWQARA